MTGVKFNEKFAQRVKPLYFCSNNEVRKYAKLMKFPVLLEKCPCSEGVFRCEVRDELGLLGDEVKRNIVDNFLKTLPKLKKSFVAEEFVECEICKEPSRGKICKFCDLMKVMGKV